MITFSDTHLNYAKIHIYWTSKIIQNATFVILKGLLKVYSKTNKCYSDSSKGK